MGLSGLWAGSRWLSFIADFSFFSLFFTFNLHEEKLRQLQIGYNWIVIVTSNVCYNMVVS